MYKNQCNPPIVVGFLSNYFTESFHKLDIILNVFDFIYHQNEYIKKNSNTYKLEK